MAVGAQMVTIEALAGMQAAQQRVRDAARQAAAEAKAAAAATPPAPGEQAATGAQ